VHGIWLQSILVVFFWAAAVATAPAQSLLFPPDYSSTSIVNAASQRPGRFAPNTLVTVYGLNLASVSWSISESNLFLGLIPTALPGDGAILNLGNIPMPLLFASPSQINFLIPPDFRPGARSFFLIRDVLRGPLVPLTISAAAPELFRIADSFVAATHPDGRIVNADNPARPGDIIVVYGTGFGPTLQQTSQSLSPTRPLEILRAADFVVRIAGKPLPPGSVFYVGLTPHFPGLYQVNLRVPPLEEPNPTIDVGIDGDFSLPGLRLAAINSATPTP
jgi:uncharacterized protein (TIGR03437 family)